MMNNILLVEDEEIFRNSVKIALKRKGYSVVAETDGHGGLDNLISSSVSGKLYDLLILDIMMPEVTGIDILEYLVESRMEIPVIVVTGFFDHDFRFFCSRIKNLTVLEKPFEQGVLVAEVIRMLGIKQDVRG